MEKQIIRCSYCGMPLLLDAKKAEKRMHPRYNAEFLVSYKEAFNPVAKWDVSLVKNISTGGILFTTSQRLPLETFLSVRLEAPSTATEGAIQTVARVKHTRGPELACETGAAFIKLDERGKAKIKEFVDYLQG